MIKNYKLLTARTAVFRRVKGMIRKWYENLNKKRELQNWGWAFHNVQTVMYLP